MSSQGLSLLPIQNWCLTVIVGVNCLDRNWSCWLICAFSSALVIGEEPGLVTSWWFQREVNAWFHRRWKAFDSSAATRFKRNLTSATPNSTKYFPLKIFVNLKFFCLRFRTMLTTFPDKCCWLNQNTGPFPQWSSIDLIDNTFFFLCSKLVVNICCKALDTRFISFLVLRAMSSPWAKFFRLQRNEAQENFTNKADGLLYLQKHFTQQKLVNLVT